MKDETEAGAVRRLPAGPHGIPPDPREDSSLPHAGWILVAGIFALIGKQVMAGEASRLPELEDELVATISSQS